MITKEQAIHIAEKYLDVQHRDFKVSEIHDKLWGNVYNKDRLNNIEAYFVCCIRKKPIGTASSYVLVVSKKDGKIVEFIDACDEG